MRTQSKFMQEVVLFIRTSLLHALVRLLGLLVWRFDLISILLRSAALWKGLE
ncbi:hypothetical protein BDR03DRAFT_946074 [Suillus americanus]|nr:hypothetical protein BDR03DRAFT_946074 [Suillus americanus]